MIPIVGVVVEREQNNSPDDMETINIWAELSNVADARKVSSAPRATAKPVTISTSDAAKIRKDAEDAINEEQNLRHLEGRSNLGRLITLSELHVVNKTLDTVEGELGVTIHRVPRSAMPEGHKSDKGYYNPATGEMTICMDNVTVSPPSKPLHSWYE